MGYIEILEEAVKILRPTKYKCQGQNPNIETNYNIWRGKASWLDYKYRLPNNITVDAKMKTLNMPRYICKLWANNYANENTTITIPNEKSNNRLQEIFENTNLFGRFNNFVEMFFGLGLGGMTVECDIEVGKETKEISKAKDADISIKLVPGRRVFPITVEDGEVTECAFLSLSTNEFKFIVHYLDEKNEYHIATFKGTNLGSALVLDTDNYIDIPTKAPKNVPLFICWQPNITSEDEIDKSFGQSIFEGALDTFEHLDLGYTAYYKEVKLGQKVKFMSADVIDHDKDGKEIYPFDENDESVIFVKDAGSDKGAFMDEFNGELRIDSLTKYINTNLNCAAMLCGLGQTHFEFDGAGGRPIQTATGVIAKQTELYRNVIKQENFARGAFKKLVMAIAFLNNEYTNKPRIDITSKHDIQVMFDDNIVEDTASKKTQELQEVQAGVMSIAEYRSHWYNEDEESSIDFVHENGLLLDKYTLALQSNVITPEIFVDLVFGEKYKHKAELVAYITEKYATPTYPTGFEEEADEDEEQDEENEDGADE